MIKQDIRNLERVFFRLLKFSVARPLIVISLIIVTTIVFIFLLGKIRIDTSMTTLFPRTHPVYKFYQEWQRQFGYEDVVIISFEREDLFSPGSLNLIKNLTQKIERLPHVGRVLSLTSTNDAYARDDEIVVAPPLEEIPPSEKELMKLKERTLASPLFRNHILSPDGKVTSIIVEFEDVFENDILQKEAIEQIENVIKEEGIYSRSYVSGHTTVYQAYNSNVSRDLVRFLPIIVSFVAAVFLAIFFKRKHIVLIAVLTILISVTWTMVLFYFLKIPMNSITAIIPPIVIAYATSDIIHIMIEYVRRGFDKEEWKKIAKALMRPCFLTSFTTAVGFYSLAASPIPAIKQLGVVAGSGILITFLLSFIFIFAMLSLFTSKLQVRRVDKKVLPNFMLNKLAYYIKHRAISIFVIFAIIAGIIFFLGVSMIRVSTDIVEDFKKTSPTYKAIKFTDRHIGGIGYIDISFKTDAHDIFKDPAVLQKIDRLQEFLDSYNGVDKTFSIVNYIKRLNQAFHEDDPEYYRIPTSKNLISQYLLLCDTRDLGRLVDENYSWATVRVRTSLYDTEAVRELLKSIDALNKYVIKDFPSRLDVRITGDTTLRNKVTDFLVQGQIRSLILIFCFIFGIMFLLFRSISLSILSILPNTIPLFMNFGVMGLAGIPLNIATAMIAVIVMGIIVDDTIHFLDFFTARLRKGQDYFALIEETITTKGLAMICTTIILMVGFAVMISSGFVPTIYFGILSVGILFFALVGDLIFLPALLILDRSSLETPKSQTEKKA